MLIRTDSTHKDFIRLVKLLDADLKIRDGDEHDFYNQFNNIDTIKHVIIVYEDQKPVGCGGFKESQSNSVEIKRMYVTLENRGKGLATKVLKALELWAKELSYEKCILETGKKQPEAIALYKKNGYAITPNYEPYKNAENSVCFQKIIG